MDRLRAWTAGDRIFLIAAAISAATLAAAHSFERFGGFDPCPMCYWQRDAHWASLWLAGVGFAAMRAAPSIWTARIAVTALALAFFTGAGIATYHAGVEWDLWKGPASCTSGDLGQALSRPIDGSVAVLCDVAAWRLFGVSMAGYNALISLAAGLIAAYAAWMRWTTPELSK